MNFFNAKYIWAFAHSPGLFVQGLELAWLQDKFVFLTCFKSVGQGSFFQDLTPVLAPLSPACNHSWKLQLQQFIPGQGSFSASISLLGTSNISVDPADELVRHKGVSAIHLCNESPATSVALHLEKVNWLQKHRMGQAGRDHRESSGPTSLLKQGHPRAHGTGLCPDGSGMSLVMETPQPL